MAVFVAAIAATIAATIAAAPAAVPHQRRSQGGECTSQRVPHKECLP